MRECDNACDEARDTNRAQQQTQMTTAYFSCTKLPNSLGKEPETLLPANPRSLHKQDGVADKSRRSTPEDMPVRGEGKRTVACCTS